jgi:hypothetical protein
MRAFFAIGYALLCGLVILETLILGRVLRETVILKRLRSDLKCRSKRERLPAGTAAPEFSAQIIGTGVTLTKSSLEGHPAILVFVSPAEMPLERYDNLRYAIHAMWHKVEGNIYLVCGESEQRCLQFANEQVRNGFEEHRIPTVLDRGNLIARRFLITTTPQAVELDRNVRVQRYGRSVPTRIEGAKAIEQSTV